ncbi:MAG: RHS repeat-associated core domain-containing protein, partial [Candidatus Omnitrophota bacterium]
VVQAGGQSYQYDANGNMTVGTGGKRMEYDGENRLIRVDDGGKITEFVYDGDGGRTRQRIAYSVERIEETIYIGSLFEILNTNDQRLTTKKHIFAGSQKVCTVEPEHTYYTHSDHLGSSSVITDENGDEVSRLEYRPYGSVSRQTGSDVVTRKFTGKELDSTGFYYFGARYYDPEIGRFIQADPTVQHPYDPQDLNRYAYCRNNPVNYVDPTGYGWFKKLFKSFAKAFAGGAAGGIATALLFPVMGPLAFAVGGAIAGATTAALNGAGWQGVLVGAGMGAVLGGGLGGLACAGHGLATGIIGGGLAIGGGIHSYQQGGWESVADYGASVAGGIAGFGSGYAAGRGIANALGPKSPGKVRIKAKASLRTDQKYRLKTNYDGEGRAKSFDLVPENENYRYVGSGEALEADTTGYAPNTTIRGKPKPVFYTPDKGLTSASQAQRTYNLPNTPTHRLNLNTSRTTNIYGGNVECGTGIEIITNEKIPVTSVTKLNP